MSSLKEIFALVRSMNEDEFQEQLTNGESLEELQEELLFLSKKIESRKQRTNRMIDHISECCGGDFFSELPISEEGDELDAVCMGFNTYMEELRATTVSKNTLKEKNKKLLEEMNRSAQLAKAKDEFMSSMSHEIRTPLNGILGFTDLLLKNSDFDAESQNQLKYIKMLGDTLHVIINDILDLAKIESGQISLDQKPFNLAILAQMIYETFDIKANEKEIDFVTSVDKNVPVHLIGDSTRISQILYNLVSNAIKFTDDHGKVGLRICLDKKENGFHFVKMIVKDTGIGIPESKLNEIFEPFIQVSNDTARRYGGTGLGLSIIRKIITIMGGEIRVDSELGVGSTFTVSIPLRETDVDTMSSAMVKSNPSEIIPSKERKIKVLLAEDNRINQILAEKILSGYNFECVTVGNGLLAVEALEKEDFDVILMDLMMPEMDGYQATTAIRNMENSHKKNIPIIALTALVVDSVAEKCALIGVNKFLSKPFKADELYEMIMDSVCEKEIILRDLSDYLEIN